MFVIYSVCQNLFRKIRDSEPNFKCYYEQTQRIFKNYSLVISVIMEKINHRIFITITEPRILKCSRKLILIIKG